MKYFFLFLSFLFSINLFSQEIPDSTFIVENYDKTVYEVPMRDGVKLYTIVYSPKDKSQTYPIMMQRTCYSVRPYEEGKYKTQLGPNRFLMRDKYIFVYQDVRGRWMSQGRFDNMRPHIKGNDVKNKKDIDESSDTYDTVDWLMKNLKGHNSRVGQWGISYPGFYTAAALPEAHPALKASSPQAPIADFFFDDFHHMGAFLQSYLFAFPVFGVNKEMPTTKSWYEHEWEYFDKESNTANGYDFNLKLGSLKNVTEKIFPQNFFWKQVAEHPNYDEFWQKRSILPHLKEVDHAVMTVGGWFDAEDLYGPLNIYKNLEANNPKMKNTIVMGPWSHGDWAREKGIQAVNHIYFGDSISTFYHKNVEEPFFRHHLKQEGNLDLPEAFMFDTGIKKWQEFDIWPPKKEAPVSLRFEKNGKLTINQAVDADAVFDYMSDPNKPVPYRSEIIPVRFTPRPFMTDDQRHASMRPDVLTFATDTLTENFTLSGEILAKLNVILSVTDADFVVKLIDVYPSNAQPTKATPDHITMAGYQQLVRSEVFRGRFRNSFEKPEPFTPGKMETVNIPLQDVLHTFKKGHKVMIQIHSTWFPYIDRNPQTYIDNIFEAEEKDFVKGVIKVMGSSEIRIGEKVEKVIRP